MSGYEREVLADRPHLFFTLPVSNMVEVDLSGEVWTVERANGGDIVTVVLTTEKVVQRAYVNGKPVAPDHPPVAALVDEWTPPRKWEPGPNWSNLGSADATLFDRALTPEQIAAHHAAWNRP
jgi:hypothetical protein